ncbi:MAG: hypothetical protein LBV15_00370, partial [Planctomycetota bacterium]|nr:hypothetical protein [Planctomycetota bacterium]
TFHYRHSERSAKRGERNLLVAPFRRNGVLLRNGIHASPADLPPRAHIPPPFVIPARQTFNRGII